MNRRGITIIETVFSIVIISVLIIAVLGGASSVARSRMFSGDRRIAAGLADELVAEAISIPIPSNTDARLAAPQSNASLIRTLVNELADLAGLVESPPRDHSGNAITGLDGWSRTTDVVSRGSGLYQFTVTVTSPRGHTTVRNVLRTRLSNFDPDVPSLSSVTITIGTSRHRLPVRSATPLLNYPPRDGSERLAAASAELGPVAQLAAAGEP